MELNKLVPGWSSAQKRVANELDRAIIQMYGSFIRNDAAFTRCLGFAASDLEMLLSLAEQAELEVCDREDFVDTQFSKVPTVYDASFEGHTLPHGPVFQIVSELYAGVLAEDVIALVAKVSLPAVAADSHAWAFPGVFWPEALAQSTGFHALHADISKELCGKKPALLRANVSALRQHCVSTPATLVAQVLKVESSTGVPIWLSAGVFLGKDNKVVATAATICTTAG